MAPDQLPVTEVVELLPLGAAGQLVVRLGVVKFTLGIVQAKSVYGFIHLLLPTFQTLWSLFSLPD